MKLNELVEQLAFGSDPGKAGSCLGLYLGPDVVYLSETHVKEGKLVVDHMVRIPIPSDGKGAGATATMNTDFLADPAKIAGLIRQSMSQLRWNSKNVRVTLSHHLGLLRYFAMPAMERRFLRSAVALEAKKYIPIPFELLAHDFAAAPLPPTDAGGKKRVGVLIAVTQKKNIDHVTGLLGALKLNLVGLEVAPCSVLRLWQAAAPQKDAPAYAHVHIDGGSVRIMVVDRDLPVFFREVFLGENASVNDMRKIDLSGCLSFVQKQLGLAGVTRLRVSGNLPDLSGLANAFAAETGLSVSIQDTPKLLSVKNGDWGGYASLGASVQAPESAPPPLNLATAGRVTDDERQTARDILIAGALLALFFAGAGLLNMATYAYHAQDLHRYQKKLDPDIALAFGTLQPAGIEALLKDMQLQLGQLRGVVAGSRLQISAVLKEIIDAMPEKLWIDHLSITNDLLAPEKAFNVNLAGHVQDRSVAEEQAMAFNFKENLIKNHLLGQAFEISISLEKSSESDNITSAATDMKALAEKLEKRTQFQLELKAKK
ncbi:MAG: pilus assembly protein PilM [Elusimicrobiota bacterium]